MGVLNETVGIVGSCINCTSPASLLATFSLVLIGVGLALRAERRNLAAATTQPVRTARVISR